MKMLLGLLAGAIVSAIVAEFVIGPMPGEHIGLVRVAGLLGPLLGAAAGFALETRNEGAL